MIKLTWYTPTEEQYERQRREDKLDLIEALIEVGMSRAEAELVATDTLGI